jgi:hypothetical protein
VQIQVFLGEREIAAEPLSRGHAMHTIVVDDFDTLVAR